MRYLLGGGVRRSGQRLRFSARLIDAATGAALWAQTFDGDLDDVFAMQDAIATSVVGSIEPRLIDAEIARAERKSPSNWTAYDHYLRGVSLTDQFTLASIDAAARNPGCARHRSQFCARPRHACGGRSYAQVRIGQALDETALAAAETPFRAQSNWLRMTQGRLR